MSASAGAIAKIGADGTVLLRFGRKHVARPSDVAWDRQGNVFVSDAGGRPRIVKFDSRGRFLAAIGRKGSHRGALDSPHSLATDASGNVYVADSGNARLQVFDNGLTPRAVYRDVGTPWAVCICGSKASGQFLYSASNPDRSERGSSKAEIYKLELDGTILGKAATDDAPGAGMLMPRHIHCRDANVILSVGSNLRGISGSLDLITFAR